MNENDIAYLPAPNRKYLDRLLTFFIRSAWAFEWLSVKQMSSVGQKCWGILFFPDTIRYGWRAFHKSRVQINGQMELCFESSSLFFWIKSRLFIRFGFGLTTLYEHPLDLSNLKLVRASAVWIYIPFVVIRSWAEHRENIWKRSGNWIALGVN